MQIYRRRVDDHSIKLKGNKSSDSVPVDQVVGKNPIQFTIIRKLF